MARKFLTPIDLSNLELRSFAVQNLTTAPTTVAGALYFDSNSGVNALKFWNGSSWLTLSTSAGTVTSVGATSPVTATGTTSVTIALATAYGDTQNPYGSKTQYNVLAAPSSGNGTPSFRSLVAGDIPSTLNSTTFSGTVSLGSTNGSDGYSITGLKNPSGNYDAVNKLYVDNVASGVNAHDAVVYTTTGALGSSNNIPATSVVYNNGTSGVGATLTVSAPAGVWTSLSLDSQTVTVGDRVLIKDQSLTDQNGVYTVTSVTATISGSTGSVVFTRATDYNSTPNVSAGDFMFVTSGTVNGKFSFVQTSKPAAISGVGTTANAINFSIFSNGNLSSTVAVNQGGTGVQTLSGVVYGNGTLAFTAATGSQITTAIGTTAVTKATNVAGGVLGSVPYQSGADSTLFIAPNTTSTKNFLTQTGTGSAGALPAWGAIAYGDLPTGSQTRVSRTVYGTVTLSGTATITANHALGNRYVNAQLFDSGYALVEVDVVLTDANNVTFTFAANQSATYNWVITG
jgi:hypothetical protein